MSTNRAHHLLRAAALTLILSSVTTIADAQRGRGGGGASGGARTASHSGTAKGHHGTTAQRSGTHHTATASRNTNVNRNANVNVNHNVNVNGGGYGYGHRPVARAATVGAIAVTTAAVVGSRYHALPSNCATVVRGGGTYHHCGSAWYQGQNGEYVAVSAP